MSFFCKRRRPLCRVCWWDPREARSLPPTLRRAFRGPAPSSGALPLRTTFWALSNLRGLVTAQEVPGSPNQTPALTMGPGRRSGREEALLRTPAHPGTFDPRVRPRRAPVSEVGCWPSRLLCASKLRRGPAGVRAGVAEGARLPPPGPAPPHSFRARADGWAWAPGPHGLSRPCTRRRRSSARCFRGTRVVPGPLRQRF